MSQTEWTLSDPTFVADELNADLKVNPWAGHRHFAYDLFNFLRPNTVVELGTHFGCSYFALCQAAQDLRHPAAIWAVDNWQGDEHAGFYGEDVYQLVRRTLDEKFPGQPFKLKRMMFDEAVGDFEDESIDLLHIDGFHTYEATKSDLTTWLPKLRKDGVVLMHDVAPDCGYGSAVFWAELQREHPNMMFVHSWGLGVLFPKGDRVYQRMVESGVPHMLPGYRFRAERDLANELFSRERQWFKDRLREREEQVESLLLQDRQSKECIARYEAEAKRYDEQARRYDEQARRYAEQAQRLVQQAKLHEEQLAGMIEQLGALQASLSVRVSHALDRWPRLKSGVISVSNRVLRRL